MQDNFHTFAQRVDAGVALANVRAFPFVPSRAEYEDAFSMLVDDLIELKKVDPEMLRQYVRATFRGAGTMDCAVIELFKRKCNI